VLSPSNETFVASRAFETQEFLASPDNWFRPVNLTVGPDGALYLCDMYRKTIEHPDYLPEATRKITDFESGKDKGRIYRITNVDEGQRKSLKANLDKVGSETLCILLQQPNRWWRMTAQRLLIERQDKSVIPSLKWMVKKGKTPEARVHALRTLDGLNALEEQQILTAILNKDPNVREHGIQLAEPRLNKSPMLAEEVLKLAADENARVRFQSALTLGELENPKIVPALVKIAERDMNDRWARAAVLSSINGRANDFLNALLPVAKRIGRGANSEAQVGWLPLMNELGRVLGAGQTNNVLSSLRTMTSSTNESDFDWQLALLSGFAEGLRSSKGNVGENSALMSAVIVDSSNMPKRIEKIVKRAATIAGDSAQPIDRRLVSIGLLSHAEFSNGGSALENSLNPNQPSEIQIAAVRALTQMPGTNGGAALVRKEHWNGYTPAVREAVLAAMTAQTNLVQALLSGVENGNVPPWTINPERRNNLMKHKDETIRNRAIALFKDLQSGDRMKVYEEYKSVLTLKPNAANGHAVYTRTCTSCHVFAGEGKTVGPDLTGIRNQPADVLLLHIIVPEFEMMPIYTTYNVETKDGQSFSGLLAAETTANVTLRQALGIEEVIPRSNIASISTSRLSLMPQELEKTMSKQDLADLLGFLKGGEIH
jgi:putative heme-binding domain-containing protein